ncbi:MAG TPA: GNAT family N-acetyltransferase, partial [Methanoregulaceae archaeon]|nr:GNAT family N-acetyltransferase [Methanoregulaceae archaeon]
LVDRNMTGLGLGPMLMRYIIDYARSHGIRELYGEVLRENESMLRLNRALNFKVHATPDDPGVLQAEEEQRGAVWPVISSIFEIRWPHAHEQRLQDCDIVYVFLW